MQQFRVIKHISLALGRTLEQVVSEAVGYPVGVRYAYDPEVQSGEPCLTIVHLELQRRGQVASREHEQTSAGGEQFRAPPLTLRSRYLISAWAPPPDDQELLGAVLRTFHDRPVLEPHDEEAEETTSYDHPPAIELGPLSFEEHHRIAEGLGMPVAPSASYWVGYYIRSAKTTPITRVRERIVDFRPIEG